MAKQHIDVGFQPDLADFLQTLRLTNKRAVIPLEGNLELYMRDDPEFGPTTVQRSKVSKIKSEKVKERNKAFRYCAQHVLKGEEFESRADVREAMSDCVKKYFEEGKGKKGKGE